MIQAEISPPLVERVESPPKNWFTPLGPTMEKTEFWPTPAVSAASNDSMSAEGSQNRPHQFPGVHSPVSVLLPVVEPLSSAAFDNAPQTSGALVESDHDRLGRPKRKRIGPEQLAVLLDLFNLTDTPSYEQREKVAGTLAMSNREVQVWFQNRRAKERNHKQKQQLQEHRERLERVELAQGYSSGQSPLHIPAHSLPLSSFSSPPGQHTYPLPLAFAGIRRRSLSTSALDLPQPNLRRDFDTSSRAITSDGLNSNVAGPDRPRYQRHHTFNPTYAYPRPRSARSPATSLSVSPPVGARHYHHATTTVASSDTVGATQQGGTPDALFLPLPQPRYTNSHSRTSSYGSTKSSSSAGGTVADRRHNRLPPIRMLLDMADRVATDLSPSMSGAPSSSLSNGLYSPFSDLQLATPGSQDGRQTDYFGDRASVSVETNAVTATATAPLANYTFGRNFQ